MRKIWEQMQGNEFKFRHAQKLQRWQRKRNVTPEQRAAKAALRRIADGKPADMDRLIAAEKARHEKARRLRDTFADLRAHGLI
jgi:hypothetical protein